MSRKSLAFVLIALASVLLFGCSDDPSGNETTSDTSSSGTDTNTTEDSSGGDTSGTTSTDPDTSGGDTSGGTPRCGNGVREGAEECDDGDNINTNACLNTCVLATCGDGLVSQEEDCDPPSPGFCDTICRLIPTSSCGDNTLDQGEECDDGNATPGDGCRANCTEEECGDGIQDPNEACDEGTSNSDTAPNACRTDCAEASCGDGVLDGGELCDDGNTNSNDGCSAICAPDQPSNVVVITDCNADLPTPTAGLCDVTAGSAVKLITGDILKPGEVLRGGQVLVNAAGEITCVSCNCAGEAEAAGATTITCPDGAVSPGLINAHDHITFIQNDPYTDTGERYEHRHDWRRGLRGHTEITTPGSASNDEMSWGEVRFVMGGATSIVGSGSVAGFLRNLDRSGAAQEGLGLTPVKYETFPLGDGSNATQLSNGCGYPDIVTGGEIAAEDAYFPHVSEGIDNVARNEFLCLSSTANGGQDLTEPQSAFIHSVGLLASDYAAMAAEGTALVWSPRSNITLYGDTAQITTAFNLGVLIALGTDWVATGSMNMLRELSCIDDINTNQLNGFFTDEQLWRMATVNAATAAAMEQSIGVLAEGRVADIAIFDAHGHKDYRAVLDAQPQDVALVMRGGVILYGDDALVATIPGAGTCDVVSVCGQSKRLCAQGQISKSFTALQSSVGTIYPLFFCAEPTNEPSCVPSRPTAVNGSTVYTGIPSGTDNDGDGIPNTSDNCPDIFNPVRPVDGGQQANYDEDDDGDVCDPCPLNPDTDTCTPFNPDDQDSDGVPNLNDNCPSVYNPIQTADADSDGIGDACDACPRANANNAPCPNTTIYEVKNGTLTLGSRVAMSDLLVTAASNNATGNGIFVQVKETDTGYAGPEDSGLFIFTSTPSTALVGNRVSFTSGTIQDFFGQIQISNATGLTVTTATVEAAPAPVIATAAEIITGGARAADLEGVVVSVQNPTVASLDTAFNEYIVNNGLRVDDFLYLTTPFPVVTDRFASLTGVLAYRNNNSKLLPRNAADVVVSGDAALTSFLPASGTFVRQGDAGVSTFPQALTVTLSRAVAQDTFVDIVSSDPAALSVVGDGVNIPAGQTVGTVLLNGLAQSASVTLTASLTPDTFISDVRVLGAAETPTLLTDLDPATAATAAGGTLTFTATVDLPAPPGGTTLNVTLNPADAGTIDGNASPTTVTIPEDQTSVSFDYVDASTATDITLSVALPAANSLDATITSGVILSGSFVINEIDYDQISPPNDNAEFIELLNGTTTPIDLADYELVFVNGNTTPPSLYGRVSLASAGTLASGEYLVVGSTNITVPPTAKKIDFYNKGGQASLDSTGSASDIVQNGASGAGTGCTTPDGVALVNITTGELVDAVSYEGALSSVTITGITPAPLSLVDGNPLLCGDTATAVADDNAVSRSLGRLPDGVNTSDDALDWGRSATPTPGAANVP